MAMCRVSGYATTGTGREAERRTGGSHIVVLDLPCFVTTNAFAHAKSSSPSSASLLDMGLPSGPQPISL